MWECQNCKEKEIKDNYKHCWNCGQPRPKEPEIALKTPKTSVEKKVTPKIIPQPPTQFIPKKESKPAINVIPKIESEPIIEPPPKVEPVPAENVIIKVPVTNEAPVIKDKSLYEKDFLSDFKPTKADVSPSKIKTIIPILLWLMVFVSTAIFAYRSNQKTNEFEAKVLAQNQSLNNQKSQFSFPQNMLPTRKNKLTIEGNIYPKVLPLNLANGEIDEFYSYLPDDLRPTTIDEVKTVMWLDCKNEEVWKYEGGSIGYQEKCKVYLVDRATSRFVAVQDFVGLMPPHLKPKNAGDQIGKVVSDKYVAFLREKQPESDRNEIQSASDSPDHHYFNKSEFIYTLLFLGFLGAIGIGWLAYKLKFDWTAE